MDISVYGWLEGIHSLKLPLILYNTFGSNLCWGYHQYSSSTKDSLQTELLCWPSENI